MEKPEGLLKDFESATKQHEETVVIELGTDRLIRWIGVYFILFLAVVVKVGDLASKQPGLYFY